MPNEYQSNTQLKGWAYGGVSRDLNFSNVKKQVYGLAQFA